MITTRRSRLGSIALLALVPAGFGCGEPVTTTPTSVSPTPEAVLQPQAPKPEPSKADSSRPTPDAPAGKPATAAGLAPAVAALVATLAPPAEAEVALTPIKFADLSAKIAAKKAKLTIVDVWSTTCGPCKENFPHLVEMHHKYAKQGLNVVSLSLDDPTDAKAVKAAEAFLRDKKAVFANYLLDEDEGVGYEKLNINAIPAVFLFGPDGKVVKRFTMDDPDKQFTYEQVEKAVAGMLKGEGAAKR
jgi:thiol-disulfide isomerase/thioredoxin